MKETAESSGEEDRTERQAGPEEIEGNQLSVNSALYSMSYRCLAGN